MTEKQQAPERIWVQVRDGALGPDINAYNRDPREVHDNGKPVYVYVLQQPSERCGKCGHAALVRRWHGFCQFRENDDVVSTPVCGCKCVFPPTEATQVAVEALSGLNATPRLSHQEDTSMTTNYDGFRAGMLRAAEMARQEFKRAPEAAKGAGCVWMGGYESACDHLSVVIAQAAVIDSVRIAGAQPDWQYHISLLLPDEGVSDQALLKIYQVVEHELRTTRADAIRECANAITTARNSTERPTDQLVGFDYAIDALESLAKKEGDDGRIRS